MGPATSPKPPTSLGAWPTSCATKWTRPTCARFTTRSICRWCRCWRAWRRPASSSTAMCWPRCRSAWNAMCGTKAREIYDEGGRRVQHQLAQAAWRRAVQPLNLPKPVKYGKGKTISTAVDVLEGLAAEHEVPRLVLDYRQLSKLKSTYVDALPALLTPAPSACIPPSTWLDRRPAGCRPTNPNLQNIPIRTELGREIRAAFIAEPGNRAARCRLFADRAAAAGALLRRPAAGRGLSQRRGHPHAHGVAGFRRAAADGRSPSIAGAPRP